VRGRMLYCKLRKVDCGTASVNHQVAYAHTVIESNHGTGGSPALVRFLEDKEDEVALNNELRKYHELLNSEED